MSMLERAFKRGSFDEVMPGWASPPAGHLGTSSAGVPITIDGAYGVVAVWACVRVIAETFASLPMILYRRLPKGGKEPATDRDEYWILHDRPNSDMTSMVWRETGQAHVLSWGNHYAEIVRDGFGRLRELWPMLPDRTMVRLEGARRVYDYRETSTARPKTLRDNVFHLPGLGYNGLVGFSPIALHRNAIGLYRAAEDFGASTFKNGARPAVVMTHPKTMSQGAIDRLTAQMDRLRGSGNAGKTVLLEEGAGFQTIGIPPEDAQYIETRKFQMQEIARMYRVPPHMVGDLERATFSNIEHQSIDFVVHTIRPWLVRWEQQLKAQLFPSEVPGYRDLFVEFKVDGLLRGDTLTRMQAYNLQIQGGHLSPSEARDLENRNPVLDEDGDDILGYYLRPLNMSVVAPDGTTTRTELLPVDKSLVSRDEVLAKKAELEAAGEPAGYKSLARALNVSVATIRRRLDEKAPLAPQ